MYKALQHYKVLLLERKVLKVLNDATEQDVSEDKE